MKAENLMIGDWVLDGNQIAQVVLLTCDGIIGTTFNESSNIEVVEPIPLTTEILEKNSWEECNWDTDDDVQYGYDYGLFYVTWWRNVKLLSCYFEDKNAGLSYEMISEMPIKYVHQLQHALRLCGIDKEIEL